VPMKGFELAKSRLSARLPPARREAVARALFTRVLGALGETPGLASVAVVTQDAAVAAQAAAAGALVYPDPPGARRLGDVVDAGLDALCARGLARGLVVMGDLPLATPEALARFIAAAPANALAMVPDRDGRGTNAMLLPLPRVFGTRFGEPGSGGLHRAAARE